MPGFTHVPFNDLDAVRHAADDETCAVMLEPIQGEGGIYIARDDYMRGLREFCDQQGLLLILDEVQTGVGRTGRWFAYQHYGIEPDIMTLAKALGGGVAVGAMVATEEVARSLTPGTHAATFGGNPLACAAGLATFQAIEEENMLEMCRTSSEYTFERLNDMARRLRIIKDVRGRGLMIGVELHKPGDGVFRHCLENRVRINCTHETVLRLLPALNVPREALDKGLDVLEDGIRKADDSHIQ